MIKVDPAVEPHAKLIIKSFAKVIDQMTGKPFDKPEQKEIFTGLVAKIDAESRGALCLTTVNLYEEEGFDFISHAPILILARSVIEAVGQLTFMFLENHSEEEKSYNFAVYVMNGLIVRQGFPADTSEEKKKIAHEALEIEAIKLELCGNPVFILKSPEHQKIILKGKSEFFKKNELPKRIGFGEKMIKSTYPFLSDYSHSGYLALLQVGNPDKTGRMVRGSLNYIAQTQALLLSLLSSKETAIQIYLDSELELSKAIKIYIEVAKGT